MTGHVSHNTIQAPPHFYRGTTLPLPHALCVHNLNPTAMYFLTHKITVEIRPCICAGIICTWKTFPNGTEGHTAVSAVRERDILLYPFRQRGSEHTMLGEMPWTPKNHTLLTLHSCIHYYCTCVLSVCKFFRMPSFCDFRAPYSCPEK